MNIDLWFSCCICRKSFNWRYSKTRRKRAYSLIGYDVLLVSSEVRSINLWFFFVFCWFLIYIFLIWVKMSNHKKLIIYVFDITFICGYIRIHLHVYWLPHFQILTSKLIIFVVFLYMIRRFVSLCRFVHYF